MADIEEKRISDLPRATEVSSDTLFETAIPDSTSETGFVSKGAGLEDIAETMLSAINFETQLVTPSKTVFDAINEAYNHGGGGGAVIDDDNVSTSTVYSSSKTVELFESVLEVENQDYEQTVQSLEAIRGDITEVKDSLSEINDEIYTTDTKGIDDFLYSGGFIDYNGTVNANANFKYSEKIPVNVGEEIPYSITGYATAVMVISAYTANDEFIRDKGVRSNGSGAILMEGTYIVPTDIAYIRLTRWSTATGANDTISIGSKKSKLDGLEDLTGLIVDEISQNLFNKDDSEIVIGKYLNQSGVETNAGSCAISGFIAVKPNTTYSKTQFTGLGVGYLGGQFDTSKTWVSNISGSRANNCETFTTGNTTAFIRVNMSSAEYAVNMVVECSSADFPQSFIPFYERKVLKNEISLNETQLNEAKSAVGSQWRNKVWHCFGTSISNTNNEGKYPKYLAQLSGLGHVNKGYSGGTIQTQILNMIKNDNTIDKAELITIEGFVNDWALGVPLGNITDTEATQGFYGAIYEAVSYIMSHSNATIVFITDHTGRLFGSTDIRRTATRAGGTQEDYRQATIRMCNYLNIPVINAGAKSMISEDTGELYLIDQIHHTEKGGEQFANTIWAELRNIEPRVI